jgi:hypothetical protein
MARESITDLIYQYLRSLAHAGFRDGAISGLREAFSLPEEGDGPTEIAGGRVSVSGISPVPGTARALHDKRQPAGLPAPEGQAKRGRGRPRKDEKKEPSGSSPVQEPGGAGS